MIIRFRRAARAGYRFSEESRDSSCCYAAGDTLEVDSVDIQSLDEGKDWEPFQNEHATKNPHLRAKAYVVNYRRLASSLLSTDWTLYFDAGDVEVFPDRQALRLNAAMHAACKTKQPDNAVNRAWAAVGPLMREWLGGAGEGTVDVSIDPEDNSITLKWKP